MISRLFAYLCIGLVLLICACGQPAPKPLVNEQADTYNLKTDIRMGTSFYTVYLNNQGQGYAVKGLGSDDDKNFTQIDLAEISPVFKIDSVYSVFKGITRLQRKPRLGRSGRGLCRVEIYYNRKKLYDGYTMNEAFWDIYRPMLTKIPKGFNPFDVETSTFFKYR